MGAIDDSEDTTKVAAESANDFDDSAEKGREAVWPVVELDAAHPRELVDDFFKRHAHTLVRWLKRRFGPGPPDPEDFAKAAFTRSASLDDPVKIRDKRAYRYTIAANIAVSGFRTRSRAKAYIDAALADRGREIEKVTPEHVYLARERFEALAAALEKLTPRQKDTVIHARLCGQNYAEISTD